VKSSAEGGDLAINVEDQLTAGAVVALMLPLVAQRFRLQLFLAELFGVGLHVGDAVPLQTHESYRSGDTAKPSVCD
jgi:hypothetical protein